MKTTSYTETPTTNNPHGVDARKIYGNEHLQVVHIHLKPGEHLIKHTTPVDVFFYVLEGEGMVEIGDEKQVVKKDMLIESPKNIAHCLYNEGTTDFRVLVVKTPAPSIEQNREAILSMIK
jgi:Mannose-6-phosphate isomerase